mgnify:CR=1 FL=1
MANKFETNVVKPEVSFTKEGYEYLLINNEIEQKLDSHISTINDFLKNNTGKGKSNEEKIGNPG